MRCVWTGVVGAVVHACWHAHAVLRALNDGSTALKLKSQPLHAAFQAASHVPLASHPSHALQILL